MTSTECDPDAPPAGGPDLIARECVLHVAGRLAGLSDRDRHCLLNAVAAGLTKLQGEALAAPAGGRAVTPQTPAGTAVTVVRAGGYPDAAGVEFEVVAGEDLTLIRFAAPNVAAVRTRADGLTLFVPFADLRLTTDPLPPLDDGARPGRAA